MLSNDPNCCENNYDDNNNDKNDQSCCESLQPRLLRLEARHSLFKESFSHDLERWEGGVVWSNGKDDEHKIHLWCLFHSFFHCCTGMRSRPAGRKGWVQALCFVCNEIEFFNIIFLVFAFVCNQAVKRHFSLRLLLSCPRWPRNGWCSIGTRRGASWIGWSLRCGPSFHLSWGS